MMESGLGHHKQNQSVIEESPASAGFSFWLLLLKRLLKSENTSGRSTARCRSVSSTFALKTNYRFSLVPIGSLLKGMTRL
jgi:hypothetical protein